MKIYFNLFLVLILISLNCVKIEAAGENRCGDGFRDPPTSQLNYQYWEELKNYEKIISNGYLNNQNYSHLIVEIDVINNKQECLPRHSKLLHDTLCSYIIVNGNRTDRYPNSVKYAVCNNCSKICNRCDPVIILKPILMRTNNCTDRGVAIWEFRLEKRPIQCYCAYLRSSHHEENTTFGHHYIVY